MQCLAPPDGDNFRLGPGQPVFKGSAHILREPYFMGLETPEQQIGMLSSFPEEGQLAFLISTIRDFDAAPVELERLAEAWSSGDTNAVAAVTLEPLRKQSESLYQTLIVERNRRWAAQIRALLNTPEVAFVAVGALHLSGEDGVPEMLKASGVRVARLP